MSTEGGTKAVIAAMAANMGIAVSKFVALLFTDVIRKGVRRANAVAEETVVKHPVSLLAAAYRAEKAASS